MHSSGRLPGMPETLQMLCVRLCLLYASVCLAGWPRPSEAAALRCGSDLLTDLIFVCGDRGIYLGRGSRTGYGARPRGKGIVDKCCKSTGCELHHLEMYCAKPKSQHHPTSAPATPSATPQNVMFQAVVQKRRLVHLGAPDSPKREAYRKKTQPLLQRNSKASSSRRRMKTPRTTNKPPPASKGPL